MVFIFNIIILSMYVLQYILQKSASELPPDTWTYLFEIAYKGQKLSKANWKKSQNSWQEPSKSPTLF